MTELLGRVLDFALGAAFGAGVYRFVLRRAFRKVEASRREVTRATEEVKDLKAKLDVLIAEGAELKATMDTTLTLAAELILNDKINAPSETSQGGTALG